MLLVVGATGLVGGDVCRRLASRGEPVRALVRTSSDPARVQELRDLGAEIVIGDLRVRASLVAACKDVSAVVATASAMPFAFTIGVNDIATTDVAGVESLVDAAATVGVTHFVYTSISGRIDLDFPLRNAKRRIEARVRASGMTWTILRPTFLMEAWLVPAAGFDLVAGAATVPGDGTEPISWVAAGDVAEIAARCLRNPAARNATLEIGGPEALTPLEVVGIFEKVGGRPFRVRHAPVAELRARQRAATDDRARSLAGMMQCCAAGDAIPMGETARKFGVELTSVRSFAEAACAVAGSLRP